LSDKAFIVLLVEDDARDAELLKTAFSELGLAGALRTVTSLDTALEYLSGQGAFRDRGASPRPSLILVSLRLSRKSDFKMLRWIKRQAPETRRVPVVVLAASRQPPGFDQAYDLGAVSYLVKPIDGDALQSMIKAVVEYWRLNAT
jgi:CheY-like chemotaxis protein